MPSLVKNIRASFASLVDRFQRKPDAPVPVEGEDRAAWDRAWGNRPLRQLSSVPKIDVGEEFCLHFGKVVSATISEIPQQFRDQIYRQFDECPVCGETTIRTLRRAAIVYPTFENGFSHGVGVWVHDSCFETCADSGLKAPIPW